MAEPQTRTGTYALEAMYSQVRHEFTAGGYKYHCLPLDPFEQVHMARRLAPILLAALKPEGGRKAILGRLMKLAALAETNQGGAVADPDAVVNDALDLATSIFSAAAATDEEAVNAIISKCMRKIMRVRPEKETMPATPIWDAKNNMPMKADIDGFTMLSLCSRYLFLEFREQIAEYVKGMNLKPGPALMAAAGLSQRPPGAPGAI